MGRSYPVKRCASCARMAAWRTWSLRHENPLRGGNEVRSFAKLEARDELGRASILER